MNGVMSGRKFHIISCHVLWRELCYYGATSGNVLTFEFLEQGLHNAPEILRRDVQAAIDRVGRGYSAILIGYGLCSNGVVGIQARETPLVIMRGHDCITFLLGSKDRYRAYFDAHPGTYWYSPGWIDTNTMPGKERYEAVRKHYVETYGEENAEFLMKATEDWMTKYNNAAYVDLGFGDREAHKTYTKACAEWLGWNCDFLDGAPRLFVDFLEGNWNDEDFLVVEPGQIVVASHDETILTVRRSG